MNNTQKKNYFRVEWCDGEQPDRSFVPAFHKLFDLGRSMFTIQRVVPDVNRPGVWWVWQKKLNKHNFVDNPPSVPFCHVATVYAPEAL